MQPPPADGRRFVYHWNPFDPHCKIKKFYFLNVYAKREKKKLINADLRHFSGSVLLSPTSWYLSRTQNLLNDSLKITYNSISNEKQEINALPLEWTSISVTTYLLLSVLQSRNHDVFLLTVSKVFVTSLCSVCCPSKNIGIFCMVVTQTAATTQMCHWCNDGLEKYVFIFSKK